MTRRRVSFLPFYPSHLTSGFGQSVEPAEWPGMGAESPRRVGSEGRL